MYDRVCGPVGAAEPYERSRDGSVGLGAASQLPGSRGMRRGLLRERVVGPSQHPRAKAFISRQVKMTAGANTDAYMCDMLREDLAVWRGAAGRGEAGRVGAAGG